MKTLKRIVAVLVAASFVAVLISAATGSSRRAHAGCGSGVGWGISSEINSSRTIQGGQTTEGWSSRSVQVSDDGQTWTGSETRQVNADGSSTEHEEMDYTDKYGNGCNSDGGPMTAHRTRDDETDPEGNRKQHIEEVIKRDGKCIKVVIDREWDRHGIPTKDTRNESEVPCGSNYSLQVSWEGSFTAPNGFATVAYGPDTVLIPLGRKDGSYEGSYKGQFHAAVTGKCTATGAVPITFDITAKEDEFGDLEFSVNRSLSYLWNTQCPGLSGASTTPIQAQTDTFTLPARDGASKAFSHPSGGPITTYTLKEVSP